MLKLSLVIPSKSKDDPKLDDLLRSIEAQDFNKDEMEVLVITEGTSESAKAIGIQRAVGEVIGILASDNVLTDRNFLNLGYETAKEYYAGQPTYYGHRVEDDVLTRYFALIGGNDPVAYYLNKNDRLPHFLSYRNMDLRNKTTGDNGYFVMRDSILATNMDNYYHIDNSQQTVAPTNFFSSIVHNTGGNIFSFFRKRYNYGLQHAFNKNRRWHLVDFRQPLDIWRLIWFIFVTLTVIEPLTLSLRGYLKKKDVAWFLHWPICLLTLFTYGLLILNLGIKRMSQSSSVPMDVRIA